ncbi:MAG: SGNH/GDSL hydrolase family protein [Tannerella sp.]|jgi:lysophospholipase L1-like esterase|nr:SGNH/GDSL hydrolase family protein [Tannerella sp.]
MTRIIFITLCFTLSLSPLHAQIADTATYLDSVKHELTIKWPANRLINVVFHGHSVPAGFFRTPDVHTLQAYPHLTLVALKEKYPFAVVNTIVTAIGGEQSEKGASRFEKEVMTHQPDVLFIDYALNDGGLGLERAKKAWEAMIEQALARNIKVILLTPTPNQSVDILDDTTPLAQHADQIRKLAAKYHIGLVDSYFAFQALAKNGAAIADFMSQVNHPNEKGHQVVTNLIMKWF